MVEWLASELEEIEHLRRQFSEMDHEAVVALADLSKHMVVAEVGPHYYDRDGDPIDMAEWMVLRGRPGYHVVERVEFPDGYSLSTVWLGLDHQYALGAPPLIFESLVFSPSRAADEDGMARYSTLEQAREGHVTMLRELTPRHGHPRGYLASP